MKQPALWKTLALTLVLVGACSGNDSGSQTAGSGGLGGARGPVQGSGGSPGTTTRTVTLTQTTSQTMTGTVTATTTGTATATTTATATKTATATATATNTATATSTTSATSTVTVPGTATGTATATVTTTATATSVGTTTRTVTSTGTATSTRTEISGTATVTTTATETTPGTGTATDTAITTATVTVTVTVTTTNTVTTSATLTVTATLTNTTTVTNTATLTNTGTVTDTATVTNTATVTSTSTAIGTTTVTNSTTTTATQTATTGTKTSTGGGTSTASLGPAPSYRPPAYTPGPIPAGQPPVLIEATGQWHTALDPTTGRFTFVDPMGYGRVLRGVSMTGMESGTPGDASGAGYWMYDPKGNGTAQQILENVVTALDQTWNPGIVRVPICGSAWATPYMVHDWSGSNIMSYRDWVDVVVKKERALGRVVIIDLHLWQIAPLSSAPSGQKRVNDQTGQPYTGRVDGCIGYQKLNEKHTCATVDWVQNDPNNWTCTVANAEGITLQNAHFNREPIAKMWAQIAARYKSDSGVFFELYNEPYEHVDSGAAFGTAALAENKVFPPEDQYDWDMWTTVMDRWLKAVREEGGAENVVLINGLMWGYTFHGPLANPDKYMPWVKRGTKNLAYAFHPYQHGTCCGDVGVDKDLSKDDPYHLTYCRYFKNGTPSAPAPWFSYLPSSLPADPVICGHIGYEPTRPMGMPPCRWSANAYNPNGGSGLCVGQPDVCEPMSKEQCDAVDRASPAAGGWSRYVLPMTKYGPAIATEFGSFDCSSPFVSELMDYSDTHGISYTAWALWPQNNGGTLNMGSCSYPAINEAFPNLNSPYLTDFKACRNLSDCVKAMGQPMRWAGHAVFENMRKHANERASK